MEKESDQLNEKVSKEFLEEFGTIIKQGLDIDGKKIKIDFVWTSDLKSLWLLLFQKSCSSFKEDESGLCPWCEALKKELHKFDNFRELKDNKFYSK